MDKQEILINEMLANINEVGGQQLLRTLKSLLASLEVDLDMSNDSLQKIDIEMLIHSIKNMKIAIMGIEQNTRRYATWIK